MASDQGVFVTGHSRSEQSTGPSNGAGESTGNSETFTCTRGTRYALNRAFIWALVTRPWMLLPLSPLILLVGSILWVNIDAPAAAATVAAVIVLVVGAYFCTNYFLGFGLVGFGGTVNHLKRFDYAKAGNVLQSWSDDSSFGFRAPGIGERSFRYADITRVVVHGGGVMLEVSGVQVLLPRELASDTVIARIERERTAGQ